MLLTPAIASVLLAKGAHLAAATPSSAPTIEEWINLNKTLGGRLNHGTPFALPCFSTYNNKSISTDLEACASVQQNYTNPAYRVTQFGSYMNPQWETCARDTPDRCLLDLADLSAFGQGSCEQGSVPPFYINVKTATDVVTAFKFAKKTGVDLAIKNSGHDYKGRSSGKGRLGLWTHNLKNITSNSKFQPEGCSLNSERYNSITTDAGVSFVEAYTYAETHNTTILGGYHQTIGASGGWSMGGGHSILSPVYGLGVDRVLQFKIVTPDGQYRTANACQNQDLFWALRGGGGGTFGVVLQTTHKVEKKLRLAVASISFNQTKTNVPHFLELVVNNTLKWGSEGWGGHIGANTLINVNPLLSLSEAETSLKPVSDYALSQNGTVVVEELTWLPFFEKYVLAVEAPVGSEQLLGTRLIPAKNFETPASRKQLLSTLVAAAEHFTPAATYIILGTPYLYKYTQGSTSVTPAWREAIWNLGCSGRTTWTWNSTRAEKKTTAEFVSDLVQKFRDITPGSGAYTNEGDVYEPNHEFAFWGENYPRLLELKRKYDSHGLLDCWQCVGWTGMKSDKFKCYDLDS